MNEMEKRTKGKIREQVKKKRANKKNKGKRKQVRKKVEKEKLSCLAKNRHAFEKR